VDGTERPVCFASRTLSKAETNYSQVEKEALSIIFAVIKFHKYLYGRKFTLYTDHKPLLSIFGSKKGISTVTAARLQRWALLLSAYDYNIMYKKGENNSNADALSRLPLKENSTLVTENVINFLDELPLSATDIAVSSKQDSIISKVMNVLYSTGLA
jgi:hypothetical protein